MILSEVYRRAEIALRLGHADFARASAAEVLRCFPEDLRALRIATEAALDEGDAPDALRHAQATLQVAPDDTTALATVGVLLASRGDLERALTTLDRAYQLSPNRLEVLEPLQELNYRVRRRASVLAPAPRLAMARWRMRRHEYGGALTELRRAEAEVGDDDLVGLVYLLRCEALWRAGRLEQAEQVARDLLSDYPTWLKPRLVLGALLLSDPARADEGAMLLHDALGVDPSQTLARPLFADSPLQLPCLERLLSVPLASRGLVAPGDVEVAAKSLPPDAFAIAPEDWTPPDPNAALPSEDLDTLDALLSTTTGKRGGGHRRPHSTGALADGLPLASVELAKANDHRRRNSQSSSDSPWHAAGGSSPLDPPSPAVAAARAMLASQVADGVGQVRSEHELAPSGMMVAEVADRLAATTRPAVAEAEKDDEEQAQAATLTTFPFKPFPSKTPVRTVEIWITSRSRLTARYGQHGFRQVAAALERSARALAEIGSRVHLLVVDDEDSTSLYGQRPVPASQPGAVRDLIGAVGTEVVKGEGTVDAILLIGGDDVLPFFRLPNPTDDDDADVLSDNPYGATSRNLYLPDVAVGRLPDADEPQPTLLCAQIEALPHRRVRPLGPTEGCLWAPWSALARRLPAFRPDVAGYASVTAQVAASEVFGAFGGRSELEFSPPTTAESFDPRLISGRRLLFFNLHGARDSARWYGQKDATYPDDFPTLPIALEPQILREAPLQDAFVYSECSHGAYIIGKNAEDSMALRFLAEGAAAFVGSTAISYGVLQPPLSGVDLLGVFLGRHLLAGQPFGEALLRAKCDFFAATREQQGWLDGDDQKALLAFVLYGDPLLTVRTASRSEADAPATGGATALLCQRNSGERQTAAVNPTIERRVVDHLAELCGSRPARLRFTRHVHCRGECSNECHKGVDRPTHPHEAVLCATATHTLTAADGLRLRRFMRVTLDRTGQVSKTLISK